MVRFKRTRTSMSKITLHSVKKKLHTVVNNMQVMADMVRFKRTRTSMSKITLHTGKKLLLTVVNQVIADMVHFNWTSTCKSTLLRIQAATAMVYTAYYVATLTCKL
jgi:hypothetical protein